MHRYTAWAVRRYAVPDQRRSSEKEAPPISATTPSIDRLLAQPDVERLLSRVKHALQDTLALTTQIAQIPAPTGAETERAAFVAQEMAALGLADVHTDAVGNVIGRRPGKREGPALMIAAHTDTVFPAETDLTVRRGTDRIAGPGVGDNSLGVAAILTAARLLETLKVTTENDMLFVADVGEEGLGDLRGMRKAVRTYRDRTSAVIAVEGHNLGRITHRAVGSRRYRITVQGPGGHSWGNYGRPNAIHILARLITDLVALRSPRHRRRRSQSARSRAASPSTRSRPPPRRSWTSARSHKRISNGSPGRSSAPSAASTSRTSP